MKTLKHASKCVAMALVCTPYLGSFKSHFMIPCHQFTTTHGWLFTHRCSIAGRTPLQSILNIIGHITACDSHTLTILEWILLIVPIDNFNLRVNILSLSLPVAKNEQEHLVFSFGIAHHKIESVFKDSNSWRYLFSLWFVS